MKTNLLLLLFGCQVAFSQTTWQHAEQQFNVGGNSIQHSAGRTYLISDFMDKYFLSRGFLVHAYDLNGQLRFKREIRLGESASTAKTILSNDGKLVLAGHYASNCHLGGQDKGFWMKLDTNGVTMDSSVFSSVNSSDIAFRDLVQLANGYYCLAAQNKVYQYDSGLHTYTSTTISWHVNSLGISQNGNLLVNTSQSASGPHQTLELDSQLSVVQTYTASGALKAMAFNNGCYYTLSTQGIVERRSQNLLLLNSSAVAQNFAAGFRVNHFSVDQDTVYAVGTNTTNSTPFYIRLDSMLQLISMKTALVTFKDPVGIVKVNSTCYTAHACNSTNNIVRHTGIQSFATDSVFNFPHNLELRSVQALSVNQVYFSQSAGVYLSYKVKALVKNTGLTPVSSFFLNARLNDNLGNCNKNLLQEHIQGITLQPGDSIVVQPDTLIIDYTPAWNATECYLNRLFSVSAPNHEMDKAFNNDTLTLSLTFPIQYTNMSEENSLDGLRVFPNPVDDKLELTCNCSSSEEENHVFVYDQMGILVKTERLTFRDRKAELTTSDLARGVYLLNINSNTGIAYTKRFVVTH